jgi:lipoxygenase
VQYEATLEIPTNFGNVGAVLVENEHNKEIFLKNIVLDGFPDGPVHLNCQSWIQPNHDTPTKRVFFTNKVTITIKYHYHAIYIYISYF